MRQARRRLWAACKRICAGLTSILCTSRSGLHASSASAAAARCTAGCTAHRQLTAPSSTAALIYQRARPPALAPAAHPQTSSAAAAETLDAYRWPRNYLQLREVSERLYILVGAGTVERAVAKEVLAQEDVIKTATFGAPALESDLYILRPLADTERDVARLVLQHLHGNRTRAAEVLGISRTTLWRLLKDNDR